MPQLSTISRRLHDRLVKERDLRTATSRQFTRADLLGLFGAAIRSKLAGANLPGKHSHPGQRNPAGTKLVRRFIRQSGGESTYWRKRYVALTGRQYNQVEAP